MNRAESKSSVHKTGFRVARNPCLRRGTLAFDYWMRLADTSWRSLRTLAGAN
jgi:hypothetical protein